MSRLDEIPVRIMPAESAAGQVQALLHELAHMLDVLLREGRSGMIDLRALPLAAADFARLRAVLGEGEVHARIDAMGEASIVETGIPGIWWHTYRSHDGDIITEMLETTWCPDILNSQPEDVTSGLQRLREQLTGDAAPSIPAKEEQHA